MNFTAVQLSQIAVELGEWKLGHPTRANVRLPDVVEQAAKQARFIERLGKELHDLQPFALATDMSDQNAVRDGIRTAELAFDRLLVEEGLTR